MILSQYVADRSKSIMIICLTPDQWLQIFKLNITEQFKSTRWFTIHTSGTVPLPPYCQRPHDLHLNMLCICKPYTPYSDKTALVENVQVTNDGLNSTFLEINKGPIIALLWDRIISVLYLRESLWYLANLVHKCMIGSDMHDHIK